MDITFIVYKEERKGTLSQNNIEAFFRGDVFLRDFLVIFCLHYFVYFCVWKNYFPTDSFDDFIFC